MTTKKFHILFDKTNKSQKIRKILVKKILTTNLSKSNFIIVLGGDGFMLKV